MNKVFLSAFALCLCLAVYWPIEVLSIEGQKGSSLEEDQFEFGPFKGQKYSLIPWEEQDPEQWLSFQNWQSNRELKDLRPNWKLLQRQSEHSEHVGKILQCRGECKIFRGIAAAHAQHLSRINEGDELRTGMDSVAWIFLADGTLLRVGPETALSFIEINWSKTEIFYLVRLHQGHVFWHSRDKDPYPIELSAETDSYSLPILVREANQAYDERRIYQNQSQSARLKEFFSLEEQAITEQIKRLNQLREKNNSPHSPPTRFMIVAPNATLVGVNHSFHFLYYHGGKSYFKNRNSSNTNELMLHLRGYKETAPVSIKDDYWFEVDKNGRSYEKSQEKGEHEITELLVRRIKTFELAREIWFEKYTLPVINALDDSRKLAHDFGYTLWGEELCQRFQFLVGSTRRMETTKLKSIENLLEKAGNNQELPKEMSDSHYRAALNSYLKGLKSRYTDKQTQVREMNDLQYYIWILRYGKKQN